jgi:hypothetical protein
MAIGHRDTEFRIVYIKCKFQHFNLYATFGLEYQSVHLGRYMAREKSKRIHTYYSFCAVRVINLNLCPTDLVMFRKQISNEHKM